MRFEDRETQRVSVLNLLDYVPENSDELFFVCDGHWSPAGNAWAAQHIVSHITNKNLFSAD